ncbi:hypothetical protein H0H93_014522 [Arthromyces matolae]|nr:hypothetical protein H0H93_014522 [Arthromyces matolae]
MHRLLVGDELGNIKSVSYSPDIVGDDAKTVTKSLRSGSSDGVQVLATSRQVEGMESNLLVAGFSSGLISVFSLNRDDTGLVEEISQWKETRLRPGQKYIGLDISHNMVFSCTTNGALRSSYLRSQESPEFRLSSLPARLHAWKMSSNQDAFAYGGDEVDVSVWDVERAFTPDPSSEGKKRKRDALFSGELWRAKNVKTDNLGLRQPIRITSLCYIGPSQASHSLAVGTDLGNVRRYDTRAARRPVSDWIVTKGAGIACTEKGMADHELFVSDRKSNLYSLDLRNGRIAYGYQGLSGAVNSMAPSPTLLASTAQDHFVRIHSTFPLPQNIGNQQEQKGQVLEKVFMRSIPTVCVWDSFSKQEATIAAIEDEDDDIWDTMETTGHRSEEDKNPRKK